MSLEGSWVWSRRQRVALAVLVLVVAVGLFVRAVWNPGRVGDPLPGAGERAGWLATRIDPNTADWPAWAALPLIGEKRARQIVEWREQFQSGHPGEVPFERAEDLMKVKGVGKATVETL